MDPINDSNTDLIEEAGYTAVGAGVSAAIGFALGGPVGAAIGAGLGALAKAGMRQNAENSGYWGADTPYV